MFPNTFRTILGELITAYARGEKGAPTYSLLSLAGKLGAPPGVISMGGDAFVGK